jgi:hypothetical protein
VVAQAEEDAAGEHICAMLRPDILKVLVKVLVHHSSSLRGVAPHPLQTRTQVAQPRDTGPFTIGGICIGLKQGQPLIQGAARQRLLLLELLRVLLGC